MAWEPVDALGEMPGGVGVWAGRNDELPLRAWHVRVEISAPALRPGILVSDDADGRETVSSFAADTGACVVVNGGYFILDRDPSTHVGLLMVDGELLEGATPSVRREGKRFPLARAALGIAADGSVDVAWVATVDDTALSLLEPPDHRPGAPGILELDAAPPWPVRDAVAGGPSLVAAGRRRVTSDEEVFFGTSIVDVHPRTAAGVAADGALLLLVVDGRQPDSRGVDLDELAGLMVDLGAAEALNLDGGGSSALVVGGRLLNRPAGAFLQREVMSAVAIFCDGR